MSDKKHLAFKIESELHKELKKRCIDKNITLTKWIMQAVLEKMAQEDKYK
jgi:hypothetical protein